MRIAFVETAAETDGERLVYDVVGRPKGFPAQPHVHPRQLERHDVLAGMLKVRLARLSGPSSCSSGSRRSTEPAR